MWWRFARADAQSEGSVQEGLWAPTSPACPASLTRAQPALTAFLLPLLLPGKLLTKVFYDLGQIFMTVLGN